LDVIIIYFCPALLASDTHSAAQNLTGWNLWANVSYSATGNRDPCKVHDPLADARHLFAPPLARWHRIQASVDEYAELDLAPPIESWVMARPFPLTLIVPDRFRFYCHTVSFFLLQVRQILCSGSRHKLAAVPASYSNRPEQRPAARPPHSGLHVWHSPGYPELELALIAIARLDHYLKKNC